MPWKECSVTRPPANQLPPVASPLRAFVSEFLRSHLHASKAHQHLNRPGRTAPRHQGSRRWHLDHQLHALRSRLHRLGANDPAALGQPVRHEVVTHVLGTACHRCLKVGRVLNCCGGAQPALLASPGYRLSPKRTHRSQASSHHPVVAQLAGASRSGLCRVPVYEHLLAATYEVHALDRSGRAH